MTRSNGNGHGNGDREHDDPRPSMLPPSLMDDLRARLTPIMDGMSERLDKRMESLAGVTSEAVAENLKLVRQLLAMAEDMAREHAERMERISTPIIDQLERQHHEIAVLRARLDAVEALQARLDAVEALQARLDAVEARQAEAGKAAP